MDIKSDKNAIKERRLRERYGIDVNDFVVLYIGRMFDRQKNVSTLIRAFKGIKEKNLKLLLVGDGPSLDSYKRLAEGDGRIIFAGSVKDAETSSIYNISSLFVLPSFWEGFSLTVLEAASHSLPENLDEEHENSNIIPNSYELIIDCKDETEQQTFFEKLKNEGYRIRVLNL